LEKAIMPFTPYHFGASNFSAYRSTGVRLAAEPLIVFAVICSFVDGAGGQAAYRDRQVFFMASSSEELSDNGRFQVRLEQPLGEPPVKLEKPFNDPYAGTIPPFPAGDRKIQVFAVNASQKKLVWSTTAPPGNAGGALVSNDGSYVATVDRSLWPEWDAVEIFCRDKGRTAGYSRDVIISLAEQVHGIVITKKLERYIGVRIDPSPYSDERSYVSRMRSSHAVFHRSRGRTHFCLGIWDGNEFHWLAWDAETGERIGVDQVFAGEILEDAHRQCRGQIIRSQKFNLDFLVKLRRPEDRPLIEGLLDADDFHTMVKSGSYKEPAFGWLFEKLGIHLEGTIELDYVRASSSIRWDADRALGRWDGKGPCRSSPRNTVCHHYLGNVLVDIALPAKPKRRGGLWVYLVPDSVSRKQWLRQPPAHCLHVEFKSTDPRLKPGQTISCLFITATPGRYWVKAVWDKAKPYYNGDVKFYKPQKGDYESVVSPVIEVKAGQVADVGVIECKQKVKGN